MFSTLSRHCLLVVSSSYLHPMQIFHSFSEFHQNFCHLKFAVYIFVGLESEFSKLMESTVPEMQRTNIAPVVLQLKALGISNVLRFNYISVCLMVWRKMCFFSQFFLLSFSANRFLVEVFLWKAWLDTESFYLNFFLIFWNAVEICFFFSYP